jgi:mannose-6-phosphate isomerase-like protein (cupin superfamily)
MSIITTDTAVTERLEGAGLGATVSLILARVEPGEGPKLHRHPYDETFVIEAGNIVFQVGADLVSAAPGDVVVAPSGVAHKFTNQGPGRSNIVCIHAAATIASEWLE